MHFIYKLKIQNFQHTHSINLSTCIVGTSEVKILQRCGLKSQLRYWTTPSKHIIDTDREEGRQTLGSLVLYFARA